MDNPNKPNYWDNNFVQFPRLIAEIAATQKLDLLTLAGEMDLSVHHINELFDRANTEWERIKEAHRKQMAAYDPDKKPLSDGERKVLDDYIDNDHPGGAG